MSKDCERCGHTFYKRDRDSAKQWEARRFCSTRCVRAPLAERLWGNIDKGNDAECWPWRGGTTSTGHGTIRSPSCHSHPVHRLVYEQLRGAIPKGLILHHDCGNPLCCNPAHMILMPQSEHVRLHDAGGYQRRRTHCANGHEFSEANTRWYKDVRFCRACQREAMRRRRARARGADVPLRRPGPKPL